MTATAADGDRLGCSSTDGEDVVDELGELPIRGFPIAQEVCLELIILLVQQLLEQRLAALVKLGIAELEEALENDIQLFGTAPALPDKPRQLTHGRTPMRRTQRALRPPPQNHMRRCTRSFLISAMAFAGFSPLGQVFAQFMIVWQR